jgi:hypothetical protein
LSEGIVPSFIRRPVAPSAIVVSFRVRACLVSLTRA